MSYGNPPPPPPGGGSSGGEPGDSPWSAAPGSNPAAGSPYDSGPAGSPYGSPPPAGGHDAPPAFGPGAYGGSSPVKRNDSALWSMVAGIVSLLCCGVLFGPVAIVLSRKATAEIAASGGRQTGAGMAQAGLILGIIGLVGWLLGIILRASGALSNL